MKRKLIISLIVFTLLTTFAVETYMKIEYDMGIISVLQKNNELTDEEKQWLKNHGKIIYGSDQNSPPLRYLDSETMQFKGMVIDYVRALSLELGVDIEFKPLVWEEALLQLENGVTDISDMYPSEKRAEVFLFSDSIYNQKSIILTKYNRTDIHDYKDLEGKIVAAQRGDYAVDFLSSNLEAIDFIYTDDYKESIKLLASNRVEAVVGDEPVINYFVEQLDYKNDLKVVEEPLFELESVLAVPKSKPMLQNIVNKGIRNLNRKGTMEDIYQKWYGISAPFIKDNTNEKIALGIGVIAMIIFPILYLLFSWNKILTKEVEKRTTQLKISRNDLITTFDSLTNLMVVIDSNRTVININKAFAKLINKDRENSIGCSYDEIIPKEYVEVIKDIVSITFEDGRSHQGEFKIKNKIYEISTYPLEDNDENKSRILVMGKDVTNFRISEQKLLQSNKIEAIGQLATGVAHEIRNPLGVIRNYSFILKNAMIQDEAKKDKAIDTIISSVDKASSIIDNLLNFSRISGVDKEKINMKDFLDDVFELESKFLTKKNITKEIECDDDLVCLINQDALKHIIINLISNAVDAMPDGGTIKINCKSKGSSLEIVCSDNGTGIKEEDIENIFNPFYTTKPTGKGTGLGLYLTFSEVEKLGGEISVRSTLGEGSAFTIILPIEGEN